MAHPITPIQYRVILHGTGIGKYYCRNIIAYSSTEHFHLLPYHYHLAYQCSQKVGPLYCPLDYQSHSSSSAPNTDCDSASVNIPYRWISALLPEGKCVINRQLSLKPRPPSILNHISLSVLEMTHTYTHTYRCTLGENIMNLSAYTLKRFLVPAAMGSSPGRRRAGGCSSME